MAGFPVVLSRVSPNPHTDGWRVSPGDVTGLRLGHSGRFYYKILAIARLL